MKIYAVYKGEEFLCEGTSNECAKQLGVTAETVRWWNTMANKKRSEGLRQDGKPKKRRIAIVIEED